MRHHRRYNRDLAIALRQPGEIEARNIGPGKVEYELPCSGCGTVKMTTANWWSTQTFARNLADRGWETGRKMKCPDCVAKDAAAKPVKETKAMNKPAAPQPATAMAAALTDAGIQPVDRSPEARKAHRAIIGWLEEAYDEPAQRYRAGFTDATIAKEAGAAEAYVAKVREEFFGPLGEPTEVTELRIEIGELVDKASILLRDAQAAANDLMAKATELTGRLDTLVKRNGWKG